MRSMLAILAFVLPLSAAAQTVVQPPATNTSPVPIYTVSNYYPSMMVTVAGGQVMPVGNLRLSPLVISRPITIDNLAVYLGTAASGGSARLHLWSASSGGRPTGTSINCTISTGTVGFKSCNLSSAVSITTRGVYWVGIEVDSAAGGTAAFQTYAGTINTPTYIYGFASTLSIGSSSQGKVGLSWNHPYANTPDITGATLVEYGSSSDALIYYHVSSIP
ncbi:hypothetical protein IAG41_04495 [Sphingomonas sp. JC676]|uniref:hypothetical protein n=1 Tax=Sphingomonas sp. JC676 TaxID=2768065 RepID=UPI0016578D04|nr:hypothetical protein [Sphingomonas sp. JC676]MBC9031643.1 hypothetical protein [Sphingomonas sp. JC676]